MDENTFCPKMKYELQNIGRISEVQNYKKYLKVVRGM